MSGVGSEGVMSKSAEIDTPMTTARGWSLAHLQHKANKAEQKLRAAVIEACPGRHVLVAHRDRMPPWCASCGRDARGNVRSTRSIPPEVGQP